MRQGTGNREQGTEGRQQASGIRHQENMERLMRSAVPAVDEDAGPGRDLWPLVRRRIEQVQVEGASAGAVAVPWYDWALAAGVLAMIVVSPVSVPVLLYYL